MSILPAISTITLPTIPEYLGRPLYDLRSGRFDPIALDYALLVREMGIEQLADEAGIARSTGYKARNGEGVRRNIARLVLGALARHPRSLPPIE
jgi:hypothetical protein